MIILFKLNLLYIVLKKMETLDDKTPEQKEKTFSKLQRIQNLLKKESALKKLCKNILINKSSLFNI